MTTWYVNSSTGSDSNNGTSAGTAFATLQHAHDQTVAGDIVSVAPGNGYGGGSSQTAVLYISRGGTTNNYITYQSSSGRPLITNSGGATTVYIGANWIKFGGDYSPTGAGGFEIAGNLASCTLNEALGVIYGGTRVTNFKYTCGGIGQPPDSPVNHIQINNCYVHDFPDSGIGTNRADWIWVQGNTVANCAWYSSFNTANITMGTLTDSDAATGGVTTKVFITNNKSFGSDNKVPWAYTGTTAIYGAGPTTGTAAIGATAIPFASLTSAGNASAVTQAVTEGWSVWNITNPSSIPANAYVVTGTTSTSLHISAAIASPGVSSGDHIVVGGVRDGEGIIIDSASGTLFATGVTSDYQGRTLIENNICVGNGGIGILAAASNYVDIWYNTCYNNQLSPLYDPPGLLGRHYGDIYLDHTYGSTCHNNLILGGTNATQNVLLGTWDIAGGSGIAASVVSYNLTWGGSGTPQVDGTNETRGNPSFVNASTNLAVADFHLQASSAAINAANNTWTVATDIYGTNRPQGATYDFGASEYAAGGAEVITGIVLSNSDFQYSATDVLVGVIAVTTTGAAFSGTVTVGGADAAKFHITGAGLYTLGSVLSGSPFTITLTATQSGVTAYTTPSITITGFSPIATAYTLNSPLYISANEVEDGRGTNAILPINIRDINESAHARVGNWQGVAYTFDVTDRGTCIFYTGSSPGTFTVPTNAASPMPVGTRFFFCWYGAGALTIAGAVGVSLDYARSLTLRARYSEGWVRKVNTDEWLVGGDFA